MTTTVSQTSIAREHDLAIVIHNLDDQATCMTMTFMGDHDKDSVSKTLHVRLTFVDTGDCEVSQFEVALFDTETDSDDPAGGWACVDDIEVNIDDPETQTQVESFYHRVTLDPNAITARDCRLFLASFYA